MAISRKVLEKAIEKKDHSFLVRKLIEQLNEFGWSREDIVALAKELEEAAGPQ